jgi:RNA polymerase sigma-70 factor (ECF subfamily)
MVQENRGVSADESSLIERAKQGEPAAFAALYDRHQPTVYRYVFFHVGDATAAEDLTSEVFVRLVEKVDQFAYRGRPLLAWLYTIARNLIIDHRRRAGRSPPLPLHEGMPADTASLDETAERRLTQERLTAAMAALTDDQRQVVLLKFIEGLDNDGVAQMMNKSVGAVKSLQHRALAELRRALEHSED